MNLKSLEDCHDFFAGGAISATAIFARMAAVAGPPARSDVGELLYV